MPRKLIQRFLPEPGTLRNNRLFKPFSYWMADSTLWSLSRQSVAIGVAIGLFCAYLPMPVETLIALLMALVFRGNILVAVALVWVSNPFTWPFMFGTAYLLGSKLCANIDFFELEFFINYPLAQGYIELWAGCLIIGPAVAAAGYVATHLLWRLHVVSRWKERKRFRLKKSKIAD